MVSRIPSNVVSDDKRTRSYGSSAVQIAKHVAFFFGRVDSREFIVPLLDAIVIFLIPRKDTFWHARAIHVGRGKFNIKENDVCGVDSQSHLRHGW